MTDKDDAATLTDSTNHSYKVDPEEEESDKDLVIHSLHESLHIHKEILERIQNEKETYEKQVSQERLEEKESIGQWRDLSQKVLEEQTLRCQQYEEDISTLRQEIEAQREEYQKLEINFYSYVKTIRVTDDDMSTIQPEIAHLLSQLNNTCMGLKSKMNRQGGSDFVSKMWQDKLPLIQQYMIQTPEEDSLLDTSHITLFVEKYLVDTLLHHVIDVPIHMGVTINQPFQEIDEWMSSRNKEWANRMRQQVCSLVVQQPGDEEEHIQQEKNNLLEQIILDLADVYPCLKTDTNQRKKIENLIQRASKLNLAIKGQDIRIERLAIEEGVDCYDDQTMKTTVKGKPDGIVFLAITPPFVAQDDLDKEHGFIVSGKVYCVDPTTQPR
ncbi:hypothetical protein K501DRAFT_180034 [Backusella circina FSU 941]|nr:hypothetical protein K501DRAFT_180034 [Backusella circina FSU 941]